mgnify:CR=1 FL=1
MKYLDFNSDTIQELDKAYIRAVVKDKEYFIFKKQKLLTKYAKYLLDYLKSPNFLRNI